MPQTATFDTRPDPQAEMLVSTYERAGYGRVAPAILQPAEPFLDLSGEDIRKSIYLTSDAEGREYCLRPDFTIAVSRDYLASPAAGAPANFCYLGPIFRQLENGPGELLQIGIESFGRRDTAAADAGAKQREIEQLHGLKIGPAQGHCQPADRRTGGPPRPASAGPGQRDPIRSRASRSTSNRQRPVHGSEPSRRAAIAIVRSRPR